MRIIITGLFIFMLSGLYAQNFEKVIFNNSDDNGYYLAVAPEGEVKGVLLLLTGFGQQAESIFPESKLQNVAYANDILTIAIAGGRKLYADKSVIKRLNEAVDHVMKKYNVASDDFIIGGFSAGGTISLRYAEYCNEMKNEAPIAPKAVFAVDSPVDLFAIWDYFQREIKKNFSEIGVGEAEFVTQIMLNEIGDPIKNTDTYNKLTPFNADLAQPGNEKYLNDTYVRVYHEMDVEWQLKNRRRSLLDSNALPASELINRLLLSGNEKAEFMTAKLPGYRSSGVRHPHSWSIVDEVEFMQWALKVFNE